MVTIGRRSKEVITRVQVGTCFLLLLFSTGLKAEDYGDIGRRTLAERLLPFEKKGERAVEESIANEIGFLADIWLGEGDETYYEGLMERLEECATQDSIPVLERFIRNAAKIKNAQNSPQLPWGVFATLDQRTQELWHRLRTKGLDPEDKARLALWGRLGKEPRVPVSPNLARNWISELGKTARKLVYQCLETSTDQEHTALDYLIFSEEAFEPDEKEIRTFLEHPETLGHSLIVQYLRAGNDKRALQPLLDMVNDPRKAGLAIQELRHWKKYRDDIIPVLVEVGKKERIAIAAQWPDVVDYERGSLFYALYQMGNDARTVALFKSYLSQVARPEAWLAGTQDEMTNITKQLEAWRPIDRFAARQEAVRVAIQALCEWGEWPQPQQQTGQK